MKSEKVKKSEDLKNIQLSAMVICQNEEKKIAKCLKSLLFCDEIVVIDGNSTDQTAEIAGKFTDLFFRRTYAGTNDQKEFGRQKCSGKWILNLDADEYVTEKLSREIKIITSSANISHFGYKIPIKTHIGNYFLRHNGYFPGFQKRLFIRDSGQWITETEPHDKVKLNGKWGKLSNCIMHTTAENFDQLRDKAIKNGLLAFNNNPLKHNSLTKWTRSEWRFIRSYILKHGFLDQKYGYEIAKLSRLEGKLKYFGDNYPH